MGGEPSHCPNNYAQKYDKIAPDSCCPPLRRQKLAAEIYSPVLTSFEEGALLLSLPF